MPVAAGIAAAADKAVTPLVFVMTGKMTVPLLSGEKGRLQRQSDPDEKICGAKADEKYF